MEKRFQQLFESMIKILIGMFTLRPIIRILFSFKGSLTILIGIAVFRIMNSLINDTGGGNILSLAGLERDTISLIFSIIDISYYVAFIAVFTLLRRLLTSHQSDEIERALNLALRQGMITQHEFEQKRLEAQRERFNGILSSLEAANVLSMTTREQLVKIVDDSHRRWVLKEALSQAYKSGAIDDDIYTKRLTELGL